MNRLTNKEVLFLGFMLFSMLFGAGNLIFPAFMGQAAGENVWQAVLGFIISDAGLAVVGFIAIAKAGNLDTLVQRVHPAFAFLFPISIYLAIGPGLAIPRAGSLAYEMGAKPFLPFVVTSSSSGLMIYTILFFSIVFWFAKSPSKLMDRFGKMLTPALLFLIVVVLVKAVITDLPEFKGATLNYRENPISQGFLDGYQTMDGLCALIYGIMFSTIFKSKKITSQGAQIKYLTLFGLICATLLAFCYVIIAYIGATVTLPEKADNGAVVLSAAMHQLFGQSGTVVLGLIFTLACLSVCIGLVTSCAQYFSNIFTRLTYVRWAALLCIVSGLVANLGLSQILKVSVPILGIVYPISITLMLFGLFHHYLPFNGKLVYMWTVLFVGLFSLVEVCNQVFFGGAWSAALARIPFQMNGFGWVVPGIIGLLLGSLLESLRIGSDK